MKRIIGVVLAILVCHSLIAQVAPEYAKFHDAALSKFKKDTATRDALNAEFFNDSGNPTNNRIQRSNEIMDALIKIAPILVSDLMDTWVGCYSDNLLDKWGAPDSTFKDTKGNTIWTYKFVNGVGNQRHIATRQFYINLKNVIYTWRWEGL